MWGDAGRSSTEWRLAMASRLDGPPSRSSASKAAHTGPRKLSSCLFTGRGVKRRRPHRAAEALVAPVAAHRERVPQRRAAVHAHVAVPWRRRLDGRRVLPLQPPHDDPRAVPVHSQRCEDTPSTQPHDGPRAVPRRLGGGRRRRLRRLRGVLGGFGGGRRLLK